MDATAYLAEGKLQKIVTGAVTIEGTYGGTLEGAHPYTLTTSTKMVIDIRPGVPTESGKFESRDHVGTAMQDAGGGVWE
ncbi:hypothetical protein FRC10_003150 [Ceratobasidium sp. 414]|nr:hypothetical protein FRC10_003150 [Ceratobasidium sp. 414]